MCAVYGLKKGPMAPIFVEVTSKKDPLYFTLAMHKLYSLKAS